MAYIPGYTFDIFISYAHLDNEKMPDQREGWIELFYKSLNLKLAQRIGNMDLIKIWWDSKKLDGSKLFDTTIEEGIRNSAIMISLISPGYLQSEYCKKEMELFYSKAKVEKTGLSVGDNSRMIKVLLNNIPYTQLPEQFGHAAGFPFFNAEDRDDFGDPLNTSDPMFGEQLKDLRDAIIEIFENFPQEEAINTGGEDPDNKDKFKIFFGEVSDTLRSVRKRTIAELETTGYSILSGVPPPHEATAHEEKVRQELEKANMAVHLLDQYVGREIEGANTWYSKKQVEISQEMPLSKMIWVPAEMNVEDVEEESYKTFLKNLEINNDSENPFDYIRGNKSELTRQIIEYAESVKVSSMKKERNDRISVLLDTHFSDQMYAIGLGQALFQNNMQPYINPQEDDPRKNLNMLADRIGQVNKLVFLYGTVAREWVLERISAALQLIVTNNYPIEDFYIYMAPPLKPDDDIKLNQRFLKINVLNNSSKEVLNTELINNFIQNIKGTA